MKCLPLVSTVLSLTATVAAAGPASGTFKADKNGTITPKFAAGYTVRDSRHARASRVELLLSDVQVDASSVTAELDPHAAAINLDPLRDRNYILLWVAQDGSVSMNATFSKTMTQYLDNTDGGLKATLTTNTPTRVEGRLFSAAPLKTMDGTAYSVDVKFAVDVPAVAAGTPLPAGGGDPGKAFSALLLAATNKNWPGIKAACGPSALKMFDNDYDTPAEKAKSANDMLNAWLARKKMKITGGQLHAGGAILEVEGEMFEGQNSLSLVQMVKSGPAWQFERATRVGLVP
jgi:hypothetical protein